MADRFGLDNSWKKLRQKWEQTQTTWNDPVSREFEKNFLIPLADQKDRTLRELERLTEAIDQVASQLLATGATIHWASRHTDESGAPKKKKKQTRSKFTCPGCGLNAWAKPGAYVICGNCDIQLEEQGV